MEYLAQYSSDEEQTSGTDSSPQPQSLPAPPPPVDFDALVSYSEDYSMSKHKLLTMFPFLRWTPSSEVVDRLQAINDVALATLSAQIPDFTKRYGCNPTVGQRTAVHGFHAHSKKNPITELHVSLFPNTYIPKSKLPLFQQNLHRALSTIVPPKEIIKTKEPGVLDSMLGLSSNNQLSFKVKPYLHIYNSRRTGSLFVGLEIKKEENNVELPQFTYLNELTKAIGEQADVLGLKYYWRQFSHANEGKNMRYHTSLMICEWHPMTEKLTQEEFTTVQGVLNDLEIPELSSLTIDATMLRVSLHQQSLDFDLVK